ncbi:MAG: hypothetical protein JWN76_3678 [Chitinophagaceae bacterium]|nr:hypothetical protein [Chitinophagaceae bacterium]
MNLMDNAPHDFILNHSTKDLKNILHFKHRTFNTTDLLYFIQFFKYHFSNHATFETAFTKWSHTSIETALTGFHHYFFSLEDAPLRTKKHVSSPEKKSTCKRLNMYLRWMVRKDKNGVDFGIWKKINPSDLIIPIDVHVARVARHFKLLQRKQTDWQAALELTETLKQLDPADPVKYDFALFALGVIERF